MSELVLRSGKRAGKRITLPSGEAVIGRDEGCHIRLTSSDVSRRHCVLRCGSDIVVADLGSRNGTYVNDQAIKQPTALRPGDLLRVGPFLFQVPGGQDESASQADISGWLTEEGTSSGRRPPNVANDTALMPEIGTGRESDTAELAMVSTAATRDSGERHEPADPIVSQAADAIRGYWSAKRPKR